MSSDYEEEYSEKGYGSCDCCNQCEADMKCSLFDEDIDHGVMEGEICIDCCESTFEEEPAMCLQNCNDSLRVKRSQLAYLEKIAKEGKFKKFKKSNKTPEMYLNPANTIGIGVFKEKPETTFKNKVIPFDAFYTGSEYDLAKTRKQKYAYSKDLVDEALNILKKIGEEELDYGILSKSHILVLKGYTAWSVVSALPMDWPYMHEIHGFLENVRNGYAIFEDDVKKEITLVDLATETSLDWSKLKPGQFEELCADVLDSFDSISDCVLTGATGDEGRDIKAKEEIETITGVELRNWCVQCKHFPSRAIGRRDIEDLNTLYTRFRFDVYCIMTSGTFSPNAIRLLDEYEKQGYKIRQMDRRFLEKRIKKFPNLLKKFCALTAT